jgi:hypothetical protein
MRPICRLAASVALLLLFSGCSRSNNLFLGEVRADVDGREVVVTDCYRWSVPPPVKAETSQGSEWRFAPCRDAVVVIRSGEAFVNGRGYGRLAPGRRLRVDHGKVSIE